MPPSLYVAMFVTGFLIVYLPFRFKSMILKRNFFETQINSLLVKSEPYQGMRSVRFHFANGLTVCYPPIEKYKLVIGDSVQKEANTYNYNVYRRQANGEYTYLATYDYLKSS